MIDILVVSFVKVLTVRPQTLKGRGRAIVKGFMVWEKQ